MALFRVTMNYERLLLPISLYLNAFFCLKRRMWQNPILNVVLNLVEASVKIFYPLFFSCSALSMIPLLITVNVVSFLSVDNVMFMLAIGLDLVAIIPSLMQIYWVCAGLKSNYSSY